MSYLQLTAAGIRETADLRPLGDWCQVAVDQPHPDEETHFTSEADLDEQSAAFETVLDQLSEWLNRIHHSSFPREYWHLLLYRFLYEYIDYIHVRRKIITQALADDSLRPVVLCEQDWETPESDAVLHRQVLESDRFNLQLFSQIVRAAGVPSHSLSPDQFEFGDEVRPRRTTWRRTLQNLRNRWRSRGTVSRNDDAPLDDHSVVLFDTHFPPQAVEILRASNRYSLYDFGGWPLQPKKFRVNKGLRRTLRSTAEKTTLAHAVLESLQACLPIDYVEGFRYHETQADRVLKRGVPSLIVAGYLSHVWSRCYVARCRMQGSRLAFVQHGGNYGEGLVAPYELAETALADVFVNWGWSSDGTHASLPAPRLMKAMDSIQGDAAERLLFVLTVDGRYPGFRGRSRQAPEFLNSIGQELQSRTTVRYRMRTGGDRSYCCGWMQRFPRVTFDPGRDPVFRALSESRLIVISYALSTTFLECLAAGRPAMILDAHWKKRIRPSAGPFYEQLAAAGIIHEDSRSCGELVARIYDGVDAWWHEPQRQQALRSFAEQFAATDDRPAEAWTEFLADQVHGTRRREQSLHV